MLFFALFFLLFSNWEQQQHQLLLVKYTELHEVQYGTDFFLA